MNRKSVGGILGLLVFGATILFAGSAAAWTLSWTGVTTYTDNTLIEPTRTISYNVERNGAIVSTKQSATSFAFTTGHKTSESFRVQTELDNGDKSEWTPPFAWTSPPGVPAAPSGITVR